MKKLNHTKILNAMVKEESCGIYADTDAKKVCIFNPYRIMRVAYHEYAASIQGTKEHFIPLEELATMAEHGKYISYGSSKHHEIKALNTLPKRILDIIDDACIPAYDTYYEVRKANNWPVHLIHTGNNKVYGINADFHNMITSMSEKSGCIPDIYAGDKQNSAVLYNIGSRFNFASLPILTMPGTSDGRYALEQWIMQNN